MKKDKEKYQPAFESTTAGESKASSVALTLQLLNKEKEKKDSAAEAVKVRCRTCFKEIAPKILCFGHGGGGGGGGGASSDSRLEDNASPGEKLSLTKSQKMLETLDDMIGDFSSEALDSESNFDSEIIAELIAKGLLLVDNDRESMTLTIKLLCEPNVLTEKQREELKKFMEAIIKEFNEFKVDNHLSDNCMQITHDKQGNIQSLRISMPTLALYDAFIQRLANNLVPVPSPKVQEKAEVTKERNRAPNPLSKEPQSFNPSPFKITPW